MNYKMSTTIFLFEVDYAKENIKFFEIKNVKPLLLYKYIINKYGDVYCKFINYIIKYDDCLRCKIPIAFLKRYKLTKIKLLELLHKIPNYNSMILFKRLLKIPIFFDKKNLYNYENDELQSIINFLSNNQYILLFEVNKCLPYDKYITINYEFDINNNLPNYSILHEDFSNDKYFYCDSVRKPNIIFDFEYFRFTFECSKAEKLIYFNDNDFFINERVLYIYNNYGNRNMIKYLNGNNKLKCNTKKYNNFECKMKLKSKSDFNSAISIANNMTKFIRNINQKDIYYNPPKYSKYNYIKIRIENDNIFKLIKYTRNLNINNKSNIDCFIFNDIQDIANYIDNIKLNEKCRVIKNRKLFIYKNSRIHIDNVKNLGHFIEFECINNDEKELKEVISLFNSINKKKIYQSYSELLIL